MLKTTAEQRKMKVIEYVKNEIRRGRHPSYKELQNKYNISYFNINLGAIYSTLGVKFLHIPKRRPTGCNEILKKELIDYIKNEIKGGHCPSRRQIEKKFRVHISDLFGNIENLYISAGSRYIQKNSQEIKRRKADLLMDLVLYILPGLHLKLIKKRNVRETGIDILTKNTNGKIVGIELKAYNKYERVKKRDIEQLNRFLIEEKLDKAILISTASAIQVNLKIPSNIKLILFSDFVKLCNKDMMNLLKFIRNYSIHKETYEKRKKRNEIVRYLRNKIGNDEKVSISKICKGLNLHFYTYFESIYDAFNEANILIPSRNINGIRNEKKRKKAKEELLSAILSFVKKEVKKGYYPTEQHIKNKFGIGCLRHFTKMSDIYRKLGLPTYLERKTRKRVISHTS